MTKAAGQNQSANSSKRSWLPIAIAVIVGVIVVVLVVVVVLLLLRARRRRRAARPVHPSDGQRVESLGQALAIADARVRQISDYVAKHHQSIGAEAQTRFDEAKRQLAAARSKEAGIDPEAIAHANGASTLAAHAQTLANTDVLAAHRTPQRRGAAGS